MKEDTMFKPIEENPLWGGIQQIYRFHNNYGASVVKHAYSYGGPDGLWELAVIRFKDTKESKWRITYDTSITDDVIGYLDMEDVYEVLCQIQDLPESRGAL